MAAVAGVITYLEHGAIEVSWDDLKNGDVGTYVTLSAYPNKTVNVRGTFGTGGVLHVVGTDVHSTQTQTAWSVLNDSKGKGNALSFTAQGILRVNENPAKIGCFVGAGDANTNITVCIICQGD